MTYRCSVKRHIIGFIRLGFYLWSTSVASRLYLLKRYGFYSVNVYFHDNIIETALSSLTWNWVMKKRIHQGDFRESRWKYGGPHCCMLSRR